jgi:hypothetical protein
VSAVAAGGYGPTVTENFKSVLIDCYERVQSSLAGAVDGLTAEQLNWRPDPDANSIGWLCWHLTRVQDDHVAELAGKEQVWTAEGWSSRFALPFPDSETGYGHSSSEVGQVTIKSTELLTGYHDAVFAATTEFIEGLNSADLARIVDERFDPPVTLSVRLVSVIEDDLQHVGQAAYVRGMNERQ